MIYKNKKEELIYKSIKNSAFLTVAVLVVIVGFVINNGSAHISLDFLLNDQTDEIPGIFPMIVNTLVMIITSLGIAAPIGIMGAVFLIEYSKESKLLSVVRFATQSLAGIPSIIYGLFGMIFFVTYLDMGWSIISGSLTVSIMILPTIIRTTEESLRSVPDSYREGSLALGASKLRTIVKVVLPSALPGIITAIILSIGRIVGETAAVVMTAGMVPSIATSLSESGRTLSVHMYLLAKEGISFTEAYATATVLLVTVFFVNILTKHYTNKRFKTGR